MSEVKRVLEDPPVDHCDSEEQMERDSPEVTEHVRGRDQIQKLLSNKSIAFPITSCSHCCGLHGGEQS